MSPLQISFRTNAKDWTEEAAVLYGRALKAAKYIGVLPYNWNIEKQELEYTKSLLRLVIFVIQYMLYLMYEGFVIYKWLNVTLDKNASTKQKATLQYMAMAYMVPVIFHSSSLSNRPNLHNFINRLLSYVREDFRRLPDDGRKLRKIGSFVRIIPLVAVAFVCLNTVTLFRRPMSPHLLTSLVPDVASRKVWELIPFALIHGYLWCNLWATTLFYFTLMMSYVSAILNALNRTRPNRQLSPERFIRATRKLEVLQGNYNALFRWLWWTLEIILVTLFVFGLCGSIWNEGALAARLFIVSTFVSGAMLKLWQGLGQVFETSREVHEEWRRRYGTPSVLFRKQIKSMRPIRVQVGGYFHVDAAMTLTLLRVMSESTFNVLLTA